ncbi:hypothetical protein PAECIP111891_07001 [Paenibacillus allorhizoplanae]|uniref:Uncharacterized protein n=1 Tax=Paenibacillus allorhizoplanae TaxID=2905648 RepID=A0ABN8H6D6_9BACL|nr:hypothetical protein [Paenibacillus allorhizoplanae]CAH1232361.1 hypothetical protein PAECIP111891_07001 [Paenibacillus allorhizoplanae]
METLLLADGTVTPSCSKSHITYTLHLQKECSELHLEFTYEPKKLEDESKAEELIKEGLGLFILKEHQASHPWRDYHPLQNLMTLSLDDENGFRGAAHRHDSVQHLTITTKEASPGFILGDFPRGQLKIMINVHCIVTEQCRYRLFVLGGGAKK